MPSMTARSRFGGMMPSPIPGTPCVPHRCSEISGHSLGSTAKARTAGSCALSARATPVIHPPVPCEATTASMARRPAPRSPRPRPLRVGVVRVLELAGEEVAAGVGGLDLAHLRQRQVDVRAGAGREHQLGAVAPDHGLALGAHALGHDDDARVALDRGDGRAGDAGVAGGAFDDGHAGLEIAARLGARQHVRVDAVLHGAGGPVPLDLRQELHARGRHALQTDQRRAADGVEQRRQLLAVGVPVGRHGPLRDPVSPRRAACVPRSRAAARWRWRFPWSGVPRAEGRPAACGTPVPRR